MTASCESRGVVMCYCCCTYPVSTSDSRIRDMQVVIMAVPSIELGRSSLLHLSIEVISLAGLVSQNQTLKDG